MKTYKVNTLDLRKGDYFIYEGETYEVTEEETIGCCARNCDANKRLEYDLLFTSTVVDKIKNSPF